MQTCSGVTVMWMFLERLCKVNRNLLISTLFYVYTWPKVSLKDNFYVIKIERNILMKNIHSLFTYIAIQATINQVLKNLIPIILIISVTSPFLIAQDQHFTLRNTHYIQLTSELSGRDHELIIFLPDSYVYQLKHLECTTRCAQKIYLL